MPFDDPSSFAGGDKDIMSKIGGGGTNLNRRSRTISIKTKMFSIMLAILASFLHGACLLCIDTQMSSGCGCGIEIVSIYPGGESGLFKDTEHVRVVVQGRNLTGRKQQFKITIIVTDYYGRKIGNPVEEYFSVGFSPDNRFTRIVDLGSVGGAHGWFCARATLRTGSLVLSQKATGFCVLEDTRIENSFLSANCNGAFDDELIPAMQRIGINSRGIFFKLGYASEDWRESKLLEKMLNENPFWNSQLTLVGYILPDRYGFGWPKWHPSGMYPYSEAYYAEFADFIAAVAKACGSRIRTWVISEEYDATFNLTDSGRRQNEVARYIRQTQIIYDTLKAANPLCTIVGLTASSTELFGPDFWEIAETELAPYGLLEHIDAIGPDAYCAGPYEITRDNIDSCAPESSPLRRALLAAIDLQASHGKNRNGIFISEFGYMVPYHYREPDDTVTKRVAALLARYILIAKTVPGISGLSLYAVSSDAAFAEHYNGAVSTDENPIWDYGLWRVEYQDGFSQDYHVSPRPWVAAVQTVNRLVGNASNPLRVPLDKPDCYAWKFTKGQSTVTALWTSSNDHRLVSLRLPASVMYDLMGNQSYLHDGMNTLELSESPVFIVSGEAWSGIGSNGQ